MQTPVQSGRATMDAGVRAGAPFEAPCRRRATAAAVGLLLLLLAVGGAGTLYMDQNWTTNGFGGGGTLSFGDSIWSASSAGTATPGAWVANSDAVMAPNATMAINAQMTTLGSLNLSATYRIVSFNDFRISTTGPSNGSVILNVFAGTVVTVR